MAAKKANQKSAQLKTKSGAKAGKPQVSTTDLPRRTLEACITVAKPIHESYADSSVTWDEISAALNIGPKNASTKYLIWGAQAYGLITKEGDKYSLSATGKKIFSPESETERREALGKATTIPTILSRFYTDYNGKFLPEGEFFDNILVSRYAVPRDRIEEAKDIILKNAKFAYLLIEHESGKKPSG